MCHIVCSVLRAWLCALGCGCAGFGVRVVGCLWVAAVEAQSRRLSVVSVRRRLAPSRLDRFSARARAWQILRRFANMEVAANADRHGAASSPTLRLTHRRPASAPPAGPAGQPWASRSAQSSAAPWNMFSGWAAARGKMTTPSSKPSKTDRASSTSSSAAVRQRTLPGPDLRSTVTAVRPEQRLGALSSGRVVL